MPSKVYFTDMRVIPDHGLMQKLDALMKKADMKSIDFKNKLVAIKLSYGERGNVAYLRPNYVSLVVQRIKEMGGKPFLVDCNTLYYGTRANAVDHLETAMLNGFNRIAVGCDAVIGDGLTGSDSIEVPINEKNVKQAKIGSYIVNADVIISLTHFKGHLSTGFGGVLKNVGMGCGSRKGKLEMHSTSKPKMVEENCVACGKCIQNCPESAIAYNERGKAEIDYEKCIGCGQCVASCHYGSARNNWDESAQVLGEKIAEYTLAVLKDKPHFHISFMMDISPECDCFDVNDLAVAADVGMAASFDPVALDHACADLVNQAPAIPGSMLFDEKKYVEGEDKFRHLHPDVYWQETLQYAEKINLGSQAYELIKIK